MSQLEQDAMTIIAKFLQERFKKTSVTGLAIDAPNDQQEQMTKADNGKRFLSFLQHCKKANEERKLSSDVQAQSQMMAPSGGEFVVLEAKEMLKHFNKDGQPKCSNLTAVKSVKSFDRLKECDLKGIKWPDILLTEFHDVYYNRTESSEKEDALSAKIQQMYVGSRETASTCHVFNSQQTLVHTKCKIMDHEKLPSLEKSSIETQRSTTALPKRSELSKDASTKANRQDPNMIFKYEIIMLSGKLVFQFLFLFCLQAKTSRCCL